MTGYYSLNQKMCIYDLTMYILHIFAYKGNIPVRQIGNFLFEKPSYRER
jgi:hypothetical protein